MRLNRWIESIACVLVFIVVSMRGSAVHTEEAMSPGSRLPVFKLNMPDSPQVEAYLGMTGIKTFSLSQIPAKLIVVEFFNVFCPKCQESAAINNRLYKIIKDDKDLSKDIKMIGIALLGQPKHLSLFREKFKVEFPLFADPQGDIQAKTKIDSVPLILVVDKSGKVLMNRLGVMKDLDAFLLELRKRHTAQ